jgi:hypothetical protein
MIKKALSLINSVKKISNEGSKMGEQYEVGEYVVRIFKKLGRTLMTCTCQNGTRFCNEPTICCHRLVVIYHAMKEKEAK